MRFLKYSPYLSLLLIALLLGGVMPTQAQDNRTAITLSISSFQEDFYKNTVIPQFEAANPDVRVVLKTTDSFGSPLDVNQEVADYLEDAAEYLSSADVVALDTNSITTEVTRAGYLLDLAPLVNTDASMDTTDFYQALYRAFQWDNGLWAIASSAEAQSLIYDPAAFDAAGLAYPNENWTFADFENAVRTLTTYNPDGSVASPGLLEFGGDLKALLIAFLGKSVVNDTVIPSVPDFSGAELENLLTVWAELKSEGMIGECADDVWDN
jgi:multiple sugar transport system substrate-binding protein